MEKEKNFRYYSPKTIDLIKKSDKAILRAEKCVEDIAKFVGDVNTEIIIDNYNRKHHFKIRKYEPKEIEYNN